MPKTAGAGAAAPDPTVNTTEPGGPPELTPEQRAASAGALHEQAQADYDASMASVQATREQGQALIDAADDMEAQAETERDAAVEHAGRVERGEV